MNMNQTININGYQLNPTGEATATLAVPSTDGRELSPVTVIGNKAIRETFDQPCMKQVVTARQSPGVTDVVLNPDAHVGYGAPIGCVMVSPTHIYPGPVGVDIKCSMSLLQFDLPEAEVRDKKVRRALIDAILERTPTGPGRGSKQAKKGRPIGYDLGCEAITTGATASVLRQIGAPEEWAQRCEDSTHTGHDHTYDALKARLEIHKRGQFHYDRLVEKILQLGSYGGGNHFGECEIVRVADNAKARATAQAFGLRDGHVAFMSHCGSRGLGAILADGQFKAMQRAFAEQGIPLPGNDRHMVHAELGTQLANDYIDDMSMGANFATVNHMLINALVFDAFQSVFPGVKANLVYFISHNIARLEEINGAKAWVHRKGATRAFPAHHAALKQTPFFETGHPILLPGNPQGGSAVMVAEQGAALSCYSVNHGAGRRMSRTAAFKNLDQAQIDKSFAERDILTNCREYPRDEAPRAYKDFDDVLDSVKQAGLASEVARLEARFVIKDGDKADD